ncbi:MAG: hypothetical protein LBD41_05490 [Clostridiales Family XIII bacterium]|jgi:hypothetical protein|nr:hypothetical protein [Clostridiales Family XIII bacterium]
MKNNSSNESKKFVIESTNSSILLKKLEEKNYIGIDFGTSATVVSYIKQNGTDIIPVTFELDQSTELGGSTSHKLVNSVLAWKNDNLLFGRDAYTLRQQLFEGKNFFSSFKMGLDFKSNSTYTESVLKKSANLPYVIENEKDATREFLRSLFQTIQNALKTHNLPKKSDYTFSVPASLDPAVKKDLKNILNDSGFSFTETFFIEEPNATFHSLLHDSYYNNPKSKFNKIISQKKPLNILIYDFGAGTCDVSILEVSIFEDQPNFSTINKGMFSFKTLSGNNIDECIARHILLKQLLSSNSTKNLKPDILNTKLIPILMPAAETLKIAALKWIDENRYNTIVDLKSHGSKVFKTTAIPTFYLDSHKFDLPDPQIYLKDLTDIFEKLITGDKNLPSPIYSSIEKTLKISNLKMKDLDVCIFIGQGLENPIIKNEIYNKFPHDKILIPKELKNHVSHGASLHCWYKRSTNINLATPITPDSIYIISQQGPSLVVPAGSQIPNNNSLFTTLQITNDKQEIVELPICVGNENKILTVLKINSLSPFGFNVHEKVKINVTIHSINILEFEVMISNLKLNVQIQDPFSDKQTSNSIRKLLEAKQSLDLENLESYSCPRMEFILDYAKAAEEAGEFEIATDMYNTARILTPSIKKCLQLTFLYFLASKTDKINEWAQIALEEQFCSTSAYNLAINKDTHNTKIKHTRKSLKSDTHINNHLSFFDDLLYKNNGEKTTTITLINQFISIVKSTISHQKKSYSFFVLDMLAYIANSLHHTDLLNWVNDELLKFKSSSVSKTKHQNKNRLYNQTNLVSLCNDSDINKLK